MTRQEEIEQASVEYQMSNNPMCIGGDAFADMTYKLNINPSFIAGAEWADKHPREGLVDIDKVCKHLDMHLYEHWSLLTTDCDDFIKDFKEAMEE